MIISELRIALSCHDNFRMGIKTVSGVLDAYKCMIKVNCLVLNFDCFVVQKFKLMLDNERALKEKRFESKQYIRGAILERPRYFFYL